jgi:hypothetical protein
MGRPSTEFSNRNADFLPGMYVCVRVEEAVKESAITELQREVLRTLDAKGATPIVGAVNTAKLGNFPARARKLSRLRLLHQTVDETRNSPRRYTGR